MNNNASSECDLCDSKQSPCGSGVSLNLYSPTSGALINGSYLYSNNICTTCNILNFCSTSRSGLYTVWDAGNSGSSLLHWAANGGNCRLVVCGTCRSSDERMKLGIKTIGDSLNKLLKINVTEYDWNEKYSGYDFLKERQKLHSIGMIAQEINLLYPEVVYRRDDGYLAIKYYKLNSLIIEAIKTHQVFIEDIGEQINWLRTQID